MKVADGSSLPRRSPKCAFVVDQEAERRKVCAPQGWCVGAIEELKLKAVETQQAAVSNQPEITVRRLLNAKRPITRQPIICRPSIKTILSRESAVEEANEDGKNTDEPGSNRLQERHDA